MITQVAGVSLCLLVRRPALSSFARRPVASAGISPQVSRKPLAGPTARQIQMANQPAERFAEDKTSAERTTNGRADGQQAGRQQIWPIFHLNSLAESRLFKLNEAHSRPASNRLPTLDLVAVVALGLGLGRRRGSKWAQICFQALPNKFVFLPPTNWPRWSQLRAADRRRPPTSAPVDAGHL